MRESQITGRLRLRHLRERSEARGEEMAAMRGRFESLANPNAAPRVVSSFNLFQTPEPLAARLLDVLGNPGARILEPSAGLGRIFRAIREVTDNHVTLVEQSPDCCRELYEQIEGAGNTTLVQGDFLAKSAETLGGLFDSVVMNPPFKTGADVKHIKHAIGLLASGGRLVSLCANGPKQRAALQPTASEWIDLPSNSFASEGTRVESAIFVYQN